jgi:hypothetical protein
MLALKPATTLGGTAKKIGYQHRFAVPRHECMNQPEERSDADAHQQRQRVNSVGEAF